MKTLQAVPGSLLVGAILVLSASLASCVGTVPPDCDAGGGDASDRGQVVESPGERPVPVPGVSGQPVDAAFFALGCLSEYAGAWSIEHHEDVVVTFARGKRSEAIVYGEYLRQLAAETGLVTEVQVRDGTGYCTEVASQVLKEHLVTLYPPFRVGPPRPGDAKKTSGTVHESMFRTEGDKRSYLAGVWLRYKQGDDIVIPNSAHKVRLIQELLAELGAKDVQRTQTPRGHYPTMFTITFVPSHGLRALFDGVDAKRAAAAAADDR